MEKVKKTRRKLRVKVVRNILFVMVILGTVFFYCYNIRIKNIVIYGNDLVRDKEIIEVAGIADYPKIFSLNLKDVKNKILSLPLIEKVEVKRDFFGKLKITVMENEILFYYKYNNKFVLNNGDSVDDNDYLGYASLINFTPDVIFEDLVRGFDKIDHNILKMISEIEYTPYKAGDGTVIDDTRFTLKMNDGNTVIIDTLNIKKLNEYLKIYASLNMDLIKGVLYLDTITEDNIYFKTYEEIEEEPPLEEEVRS